MAKEVLLRAKGKARGAESADLAADWSTLAHGSIPGSLLHAPCSLLRAPCSPLRPLLFALCRWFRLLALLACLTESIQSGRMRPMSNRMEIIALPQGSWRWHFMQRLHRG